MDFEVCFLPREATRQPSPVAVLIDVIRASTTIVTLLDRGSPEVVLVGQRDRPRLGELRARLGALVCAEDASGLKAADADLSPSPSVLHDLDLKGRRVILATTNVVADPDHDAASTIRRLLYIGPELQARPVMTQLARGAPIRHR